MMFDLTRRHWLGLAAATAAMGTAARAAAPGAARIATLGEGKRDYGAAVDALARLAASDLEAWGFPGMTLGLSTADGFAATIALGAAQLAPEVPVGPGQLFQIGSISKSLAAFAALRLAGEGRLDLDAPVSALLPDLPLPAAPVTANQLMVHSAGFAHDAPLFPRVPDGRLWSGFAPGSAFSYSNTGYNILGLVIARAAGMPYPAALRALVLRPLGMTGALPLIRAADRARYATGYTAFLDRPFFAGARLAPGPWTESDFAAGSVAATPADMVRYIRFVAQVGRGKGAPLFPDKLAARYAAPGMPAPELGKGAHYAGGLMQMDSDGLPILFHTGGMVLFSSAVAVDPASGAGVFASVNVGLTGYRPRLVARHGAALLRAAALGQPLPAAPPLRTVPPVEDAAAFAGRYVPGRGEPIEVTATRDALFVRYAGSDGRLQPARAGAFLTDHPQLYRHEIAFADPKSGKQGLWWGGARYGAGGPAEPPPVPPPLRAAPGLYVSNDPWVGSASVVARGDRLVLEGVGELTPQDDYYLVKGDDGPAVERVRFEAVMAGRATRLNFSGSDLLRFSEDDGPALPMEPPPGPDRPLPPGAVRRAPG